MLVATATFKTSSGASDGAGVAAMVTDLARFTVEPSSDARVAVSAAGVVTVADGASGGGGPLTISLDTGASNAAVASFQVTVGSEPVAVSKLHVFFPDSLDLDDAGTTVAAGAST